MGLQASTLPVVRYASRPASYEYKLHLNGHEEPRSTRLCHESVVGDGAADEHFVDRVATRVAQFRQAVGPCGPLSADEGQEDWVVVHTRVAQRAEPSTVASIVGMKMRGEFIRGTVEDVSGLEWLRMEVQVDNKQSRTAWILIHGRSVGLGQLLERVVQPPDISRVGASST